MAIYAAPSYAMGAVSEQGVTPQEKARAESEIRKMRKALAGWLKYRSILNGVAQGTVRANVDPATAQKIISAGRDWALEQRMADRLHALLSETMDAQGLPDPDVTKDPDAAVKLARIAVAGRLPSEASSSSPQGFFWIWPAVVVVGLVLFTLVYKIRSDADSAEEKERIECIKMGACTDYGFWLKLGGVALVAWIAWDKFGLRDLAIRARRRAGGG